MYMKIHCTFSLSSDVVTILDSMKNKSLYIENLIKNDMDMQKDEKLNDIDIKIQQLNKEKEQQIRELEKANAKKIEEELKNKYNENLELWESRKKRYFDDIFFEEEEERIKFSDGLGTEWNNINEFYEKVIEVKPTWK